MLSNDKYSAKEKEQIRNMNYEDVGEFMLGKYKQLYTDGDFIFDTDYGLTPFKPISNTNILEAKDYLRGLCNESGEVLTWERRGSCGVPSTDWIVDIYDGFINDKKIITIYINPYGIVTSKKLPQEPSLTRKINN